MLRDYVYLPQAGPTYGRKCRLRIQVLHSLYVLVVRRVSTLGRGQLTSAWASTALLSGCCSQLKAECCQQPRNSRSQQLQRTFCTQVEISKYDSKSSWLMDLCLCIYNCQATISLSLYPRQPRKGNSSSDSQPHPSWELRSEDRISSKGLR